MWHGLKEYLVVAALVGLVLHALIRRFVAASFAGAVVASLGNLAHETWLADFDVNPGWFMPIAVPGIIVALPACALAGLPFRLWRRHRVGPTDGPRMPMYGRS